MGLKVELTSHSSALIIADHIIAANLGYPFSFLIIEPTSSSSSLNLETSKAIPATHSCFPRPANPSSVQLYPPLTGDAEPVSRLRPFRPLKGATAFLRAIRD